MKELTKAKLLIFVVITVFNVLITAGAYYLISLFSDLKFILLGVPSLIFALILMFTIRVVNYIN